MSILVQTIIFIAAALLLVPLGKRFGIPTVLGYLFTGIILGADVLNLARDTQSISHLADYGVIMLMFLIGLELRPQRLWQMREAIFVLGGLQMLTCGLMLMGIIALLTPLSWLPALVVGFALALSSTAFVMQLLEDREQLKSFYGQQSFAVLLLQDIAAMVLLAIIPLLATAPSDHPQTTHGVGYFAAVLATFSGLFLFSRYCLRPLFRFVVKSGAQELLTAVGLFIVLTVVLLMDTLGISTTLGAFLTGVLLADSEFRHEIEGSIAPFKGLLLGLFFMTVGMQMQLTILWQHPLLLIAAALGLLLIKMLCTVAVARWRKQSLANSIRLGVAVAQGGEFAFVVFALAQSQAILPNNWVAPLSIMVTLSMMMTPLLFWLLDRWGEPSFARQEQQVPFDELPQQKQHIVLAGFGRFGQIVSRIAHLHHIPFIAIDNNLAQIDFVRKFGGQVYYGDPTVAEVLQSAHLSAARLIVIVLNDVESSLNIARHVRLHYPDLTILARAHDRHHVHLLRDIGVHHIWRDTYHSALAMSEQLLIECGHPPEVAHEHIEQFNEHDQALLCRQQGIYTDIQQIIETQREMVSELQNLFENDNVEQNRNPHYIPDRIKPDVAPGL